MACGNCRGAACSNKEKIEFSEIPGEDEATMIGKYLKYNKINHYQDLENKCAHIITFIDRDTIDCINCTESIDRDWSVEVDKSTL